MKANVKKTFFALFLAIVATIGLYVFLFLNVLNINAEIANLSRQIEEDKKRESSFVSIESALEQIEEKRDSLFSYLVTEENIVFFFQYVEELGEWSGVSVVISDVSIPDEGNGASRLKLLTLSLRTQGTFADLQRYVALLESLPFSTDVKTVRFTQDTVFDEGGNQVGRDTWKADIEFSVMQLFE